MASPIISVEYHQGLERLEKLLSAVKRPGGFYVHGTLEMPLPRVEVDGVGLLSFPVPEAQVRSLIAQSSLAPYGRGQETIVDSSVRRVWQLPPEKVRISGKSWPKTFEAIRSRVSAGLGCKMAVVSAQLYKLLVYDQGAFFISHRDTEKAEGMFGTLVVVLPSLHRGGELILRHGGSEVTVDTSQAEVSELVFAAFYADCEHEVRPIETGNRVCLVYNLIQERHPEGRQEPLTAPAYATETSVAGAMIQEDLSRADAPVKLAWLLEHQYTPAGLSFAGLKNADAALAKVLAPAAAQAGCDVHLAMVHIEESGSAELGFDPNRRSRRHWYAERAQGPGSESFEVIEIIESSQYVDDWVELQDRGVKLGKIPLSDGEILPQGSLDGEEPDEQRVMEATGNEGASFERAYHRAALVFWRQDRLGDVLLQAGVGAALPHLKDQVRRATAASASAADREQAAAFAQRAVNAWEAAEERYRHRARVEGPMRSTMLDELRRLGDAGLLERFLSAVVTKQYEGSENGALVAAARFLGAAKSGALLAQLIEKKMPSVPRECVSLLQSLVEKEKSPQDPPWRESLHRLGVAVVAELEKVGNPEALDPYERWRHTRDKKAVDGQLVSDLLTCLERIEAHDLQESAAAVICARPAVFEPNTVLAPALALLRARQREGMEPSSACLRLWKHAVELLLARSEAPPEPPRDWRQEVKLRCQCQACRELEAFAHDPVRQEHRFRMRQDRRTHLQHAVETGGLDMKHATERTGSPQTLVCTKTRRTYLERLEQYKQDIGSLATLGKLAGGARGEIESLTARIAAAVERSTG